MRSESGYRSVNPYAYACGEWDSTCHAENPKVEEKKNIGVNPKNIYIYTPKSNN